MSDLRKDYMRFFSRNLLQGLVAFVFIVIGVVLFKNYLHHHYQIWLAPIKNNLAMVYVVFFLNELILGLIPPEFFMFLHVDDPPTVFWAFVTLMVVLSYLGGLSAFFFGQLTQRSTFMRRWIASPRLRPLITYYNKYGGIIIFIAAVTPVPFALTSMLSGALGYRFSSYIKYAALRLLRFYPYAALVYTVGTVNLLELLKKLFAQ